MYPTISLKPGKEVSVFRRHKWIFSGAINKTDKSLKNGDLVKIVDNKNNFLAIGHYFDNSIAIRILSFNDEIIDKNFWIKSIQKAYNFRKNALNLPNENTNAFRLVFGESDGIPGLIVDVYKNLAVVQCHTRGIYNALNDIVEAIIALPLGIEHIYNKSSSLFDNKSISDGFVYGKCSNNIEIAENSLKFNIDFIEGQKTGFFLDQKYNRQLLQKYSEGKRVLNLFSYSGSFSVYALAGGAKEVVNVDVSEKAIELAKTNILLNFENATNFQNITSDCFDFLRNQKTKYDLIIVDPPAFAKTIAKQDNALNAYRKLNETAMRQLADNGLFFSYSCSQVVAREKFQQSLFIAAANNKRNARIINNLYQSPDHPIDLFHPETNYLKGFVLFID